MTSTLDWAVEIVVSTVNKSGRMHVSRRPFGRVNSECRYFPCTPVEVKDLFLSLRVFPTLLTGLNGSVIHRPFLQVERRPESPNSRKGFDQSLAVSDLDLGPHLRGIGVGPDRVGILTGSERRTPVRRGYECTGFPRSTNKQSKSKTFLWSTA